LPTRNRAIAELDRQIAALSSEGPEAQSALRTARFNRIVALSSRGRTSDVIAEYEALTREGVDVPPFVLSVVAGTYQTLRDPNAARRLYEAALAGNPKDFLTRLSLFYAQIESEDYDSAFRTIDALAANSLSPFS